MIEHIFSYIFSIHFANFICVVGVLGYVIKTRLLPLVDKGIAEKEAAKLALKDLIHVTEQECESVEKSSQEQKLYAQELLERLKTWNVSVQTAREQEAKSKQRGTRAITTLLKKQKTSLEQMYLVEALTPLVISEATQQLKKVFSSKNKQQEFLKNALDDLEQETA